ncbi:glycosyl transferase [Dulcicalothrix desertica PCC 7102]|uniref:Glycosyl transferase n=1 Tax=Dulcicalothrix desertica PCC 7102 TaxID=232991 RepID=A0A433VQF3_9CYAN|nr:glycosyltransferase family 2 protein [Dulcicalothrix desertica]RUT08265.1 glycosyl transferase [Dulcicalothrix desertica PCC 7102]TWH40133.1 cellulose synthase/poly-beta-1,6-N-acetylglucosamine synthase-like glycosyltransferase [Dulcicalothrix desertica PCC 7102]
MYINQLVHLSIEIILLISAFFLLVLGSILLIECIAALFPLTSTTSKIQTNKVAVLIPAHNEEAVISNTLKSLKSTLLPHHKIVVVADNCTDATAEIASRAGVTVIERQDENKKGKGYALDYGLKFLENDPPEVVVFIDADCVVQRNTITLLTEKANSTGRPAQAVYLMSKPNQPTPKDSISVFAFKVKNLVRSRGLVRMGLPCLLAGTGMAFPWPVIRSVDLANSEIVEDMKLGLDLTIAGYPPIFCPQASVNSSLPQNAKAAKSQRTRWEHGHIQTLLTYVPKLITNGVRQRRLDLFFSALDLCIPPLSLFVAIWFGLMCISLIFAFVTSISTPASVIAIAGVFILTAILIAWSNFARSDLPLLELLAVPFYILWKIPLYFKFLIQPQKTWIRTERDV